MIVVSCDQKNCAHWSETGCKEAELKVKVWSAWPGEKRMSCSSFKFSKRGKINNLKERKDHLRSNIRKYRETIRLNNAFIEMEEETLKRVEKELADAEADMDEQAEG